jgi:hypothetical protein
MRLNSSFAKDQQIDQALLFALDIQHRIVATQTWTVGLVRMPTGVMSNNTVENQDRLQQSKECSF